MFHSHVPLLRAAKFIIPKAGTIKNRSRTFWSKQSYHTWTAVVRQGWLPVASYAFLDWVHLKITASLCPQHWQMTWAGAQSPHHPAAACTPAQVWNKDTPVETEEDTGDCVVFWQDGKAVSAAVQHTQTSSLLTCPYSALFLQWSTFQQPCRGISSPWSLSTEPQEHERLQIPLSCLQK